MSLHIVILAPGHQPDIGDCIIKVQKLELLPEGGTGWVEYHAALMDVDTETKMVRPIPVLVAGREAEAANDGDKPN